MRLLEGVIVRFEKGEAILFASPFFVLAAKAAIHDRF